MMKTRVGISNDFHRPNYKFFRCCFDIYGVLTLWFISGEIQSKQPVKTGNHAFTCYFSTGPNISPLCLVILVARVNFLSLKSNNLITCHHLKISYMGNRCIVRYCEALVYALAKEGAKLILSARRSEELQRVADKAKLSARII